MAALYFWKIANIANYQQVVVRISLKISPYLTFHFYRDPGINDSTLSYHTIFVNLTFTKLVKLTLLPSLVSIRSLTLQCQTCFWQVICIKPIIRSVFSHDGRLANGWLAATTTCRPIANNVHHAVFNRVKYLYCKMCKFHSIHHSFDPKVNFASQKHCRCCLIYLSSL